MKPKADRQQRRAVPDISDDREEFDKITFAGQPEIEDAYVCGGELSTRDLESVLIRRSFIESFSLARVHVRSLRLRDARFVGCDFSNAVLRGVEATRVEFIDCRLTGVNASECRMDDVLFERCEARYSQWTDGVITCSEFVDSQFVEADFRRTGLDNTRWLRSGLEGADLTGVRLKGADLRGAALDRISVLPADVAGAIVTPSQAMELARLLGLVVR